MYPNDPVVTQVFTDIILNECNEDLIEQLTSIEHGGTTYNELKNRVNGCYIDKKNKPLGYKHLEGQACRANMQYNNPYTHQIQLQEKIGIEVNDVQYNMQKQKLKQLQSNREINMKPERIIKRNEKRQRYSYNNDQKNYKKGGFIHKNNDKTNDNNIDENNDQNNDQNNNNAVNNSNQSSSKSPPKKRRRKVKKKQCKKKTSTKRKTRQTKYMKMDRFCICDISIALDLICSTCGWKYHKKCLKISNNINTANWSCPGCSNIDFSSYRNDKENKPNKSNTSTANATSKKQIKKRTNKKKKSKNKNKTKRKRNNNKTNNKQSNQSIHSASRYNALETSKQDQIPSHTIELELNID